MKRLFYTFITLSTSLDSVFADSAVNMSYFGQCVGYLDGKNFIGEYITFYNCNLPAFPQMEVMFSVKGTFNVELDTR